MLEVWRRRIKSQSEDHATAWAWVKIVGFVRQAETSHVQGLFGLNERKTKTLIKDLNI